MTTPSISEAQRAWLRRADDVIAGGALNLLSLPGGRRYVIDRGEGSRVWDVDGREYVDYVLGSGPLVLGHAHPAVTEAVQRQLRRGSTFYSLTEQSIVLAELVVDRIPCAELVQFCSSGAEAAFYALRLARAATGRDAVLKFEGGFHGSSDYALMSLFPRGPARYPSPEPSSGGIPRVLEAEVLVAPFNDVAAAVDLVRAHAHRLAAILVEPVQRVLEPEPGFLEALREEADRHDIVLIFDEIVTGFRVAPGSAQQRYGVTPDLVTLGKVLGGGYPLAAVAGRRDVMELADHRRRGLTDYAYVSGTLNGNPVAASAGIATLQTLGPAAYERLETVGERLRAGLSRVFRESETRAHVLGVGPMFQVFLADERPVDYRGMAGADLSRMKGLSGTVLDAGFWFSGEKGYVSLAHTDAEVDAFVDAFADALASSVE